MTKHRPRFTQIVVGETSPPFPRTFGLGLQFASDPPIGGGHALYALDTDGRVWWLGPLGWQQTAFAPPPTPA